MTDPTPYIQLPGTAREALTFYGEVFGCTVQLHTYAEFSRTDGPADAVAHGYLTDGPVSIFASDVAEGGTPSRYEGMVLPALAHRFRGRREPLTLGTNSRSITT